MIVLAAAVLAGGAVLVRSRAAIPLLASILGRTLTLVAHQPNQPDAAAAPRPQDPVTVLVMGTEKSPSFTGQQTDSMMVWGFDPAHRRAAVLSVPRDLWVDIPGYGQQRINSAFEFGGYKTAELTVERYIGVPIEYYAVVDYAAFVKLVNDVGGIEVNVPRAINDTCYPNATETACTVFRLSAGPHHLNGTTALKFARERHSLPLADLGRDSNQQLVLFALKHALLQPGNLLRLPTIMNDLQQLVQTNLPYSDLPALAEEALNVPKSSIRSAVLQYNNGAVSTYTTGGGADVLLPHAAAIHTVVTSLFGPILAYMHAATVQVENGAPTNQPLATYFSQVLHGMGTSTLPAMQARRTDHTANHVYWNPAAAGQPPVLAYMLARMLNTPLTKQPVPGSRGRITVILGRTFPKVEP